MKITFLGQQSWAVESASDFVLVDPVLTDWFGTSARQKFVIHPARSVLLAQMPMVTAIVITNEHLDHFNLRSMMLLPKETPVFVGDLMPQPCVDVLREIGMHVSLVWNGECVHLNDLDLRLYLTSPKSAMWEKRVYHAAFISNPETQTVVVQSDGLLSDDLINDLRSDAFPPLCLFVATNNAQIPPKGKSGTYDNLLPVEDASAEDAAGVHVFHQVLCEVAEEAGFPPHIALCGGGYIQNPQKHSAFLFSDSQAIEESLNALSLQQKVHFPLPGDVLNLQGSGDAVLCARGSADWIASPHSVEVSSKEVRPDFEWFQQAIFGETTSPENLTAAIAKIVPELKTMAPVFLLSEVGRLATSANQYLRGPTGKYRFAIRFYDGVPGYVATAALNINTCDFDWFSSDESEIFTSVPFGIDVHVNDFLELLTGGIQIWELATSRMRQWHLGTDRVISPVGFLYGYFSEQVRPDLARAMYRKILNEDFSAASAAIEDSAYA